MPRLNIIFILFALLVYALTAGISLRDRLLIGTLHRIERNAFFEPSEKDLFEGAMSGMANVLSDELGDGYSMYVPPRKQTFYLDTTNNQYDGFGVSLRTIGETEVQKLLINYPQYNSPAFRAGLRSGDQILQIGNEPVEGKTYGEIRQFLREQKSETRLSVLPFGQTKTKEFFVTREHIRSDSIEGEYYDSDKRIFYLETHSQIGYIRITAFTNTTAKEFDKALEQMIQSGVKSFILDLRDNPGGDVWNTVLIARMLMSPNDKQNVIAAIRDRDGHKRSMILIEGTQKCTLPMAVLINGDSASSAEILAAALQDYRRATVVGTRSFGKGIIQGIFELPFQSGILQLTDAEYRRPNGANIHRKNDAADSDDWGIIPDRIVELAETEKNAVLDYRKMRSNVIATQRTAVLDQLRQWVAKQSVEIQSGEEDAEPVTFTGTAPYYDTQLDEAVKILLDEPSLEQQ